MSINSNHYSPEYTQDYAKETIQNVARGLTEQLISRYQTRLKDSVSSIELNYLRGSSGNKLPEVVVGRNILEGLKNIFNKEGDLIISVVTSNLNLNGFIHECLQKKNEKEEFIQELKLTTSSIPLQPNMEAYKLRARLEIQKAESQLKTKYYGEYLATNLSTTSQLPSTQLNTATVSSILMSTSQQEQNIKTLSSPPNTRSRNTRSSQRNETETGDQHPQNLSTPHDTPTNINISNFNSSIFYTEFIKEFESLKSTIEFKYDERFISDFDKFESDIISIKADKQKLDQLLKEKIEYVAIESVATAVNTAISIIITKIKASVTDYPNIKIKLQQRVILPTGEVLVDPYTSENLTGIYYILSKEFGKATLILFCNMLMDLLNYNLVDTNKDRPELAVNEVNRQLKAWDQLDLFSYMDKDKLFTISLLKSFPQNSEVRIKGIMTVFDYIQLCEQQPELMNSFTDMPIYNHLTTWITEKFIKAREFGRSINNNSKPNNNNLNNNNSGRPSNNNQQVKGERAAAADVQVQPHNSNNNINKNTTTNPSNFTSNNNNNNNTHNNHSKKGTKGYLEMSPAQRNYNREVTRDERVFVINNSTGQKQLYTATNQPCPRCVSQNNTNYNPHDKPRCYNGKCNKCQLFGHRLPECRQVNQFIDAKNAEEDYDNEIATSEAL